MPRTKSTSAGPKPPPLGVGVAVTVLDGSPGAPGTIALTVGVACASVVVEVVVAAGSSLEPPQPTKITAITQIVSRDACTLMAPNVTPDPHFGTEGSCQ